MSSTYTGKPGNASRAAPLTVTGATNATPIEITTSTTHGLADGEQVQIFQVLGNVAANGLYYAKVTGTTKFTIYRAWTSGAPATPVAGSGAYTSGGFAWPEAFAAAVTLPADGDALSAAAFNTPYESGIDRETYLLGRVGQFRNSNIKEQHVFTGGTVYTALTNANRVVHTGTAVGATFVDPYYIANSLAQGSYIPDGPNSIIEATATGAIGLTAATVPGDGIAIRLVGLVYAQDGTTLLATVEGIPVCIAYDANLTADWFPFSLQLYATPTLTQGGVLYMRTEVFCLGGGGSVDYQLVGPVSLFTHIYTTN